ncbi:transcriptional regulator, partial [Bacillus safensis]|nr:transcriptional regulator [Bacillus safensis]
CQQLAEYFFVNNSFLSREFSALMSCTLSHYIVASKIHFSTCDLLNGVSLNTLWQDYHFRSFNDYINHFQTIKGIAPYKIKINPSSLEHIQSV